MSFFDTAQRKAKNDRHWKQVESGLTAAAAAAVIFLAKAAIEHATTRQPQQNQTNQDSLVDRMLRGF